jgi:two-component system, LuxR family, sensor histidine kinase TtrS
LGELPPKRSIHAQECVAVRARIFTYKPEAIGREDLLRLVGRIRNDTLRAGEVIKRLRTLLARHEARRQPLDLNVALTDVEVFLRPELERRDMALALRPAPIPARILGDEM